MNISRTLVTYLVPQTGKSVPVPPAAILDIDGTLVDTNYHHAIAWYRAFRQHQVTLPIWKIHRHMGMGGDHLVQALTSEAFDEQYGEDVRAAEKVLYMELIEECAPMNGSRELIEDLKRRGHAVVLASSAKASEVDYYLDLLDARELADALDHVRRRRVDRARAGPGAGGDRKVGRVRGRHGRRHDLGHRGRGARERADDRGADRRLRRGRAARGGCGLCV